MGRPRSHVSSHPHLTAAAKGRASPLPRFLLPFLVGLDSLPFWLGWGGMILLGILGEKGGKGRKGRREGKERILGAFTFFFFLFDLGPFFCFCFQVNEREREILRGQFAHSHLAFDAMLSGLGLRWVGWMRLKFRVGVGVVDRRLSL